MEHEEKEMIISKWFNSWLSKNSLDFEGIFSEEVIYIESWGPRYEGIEEIKDWFEAWNQTHQVLVWKIKQFFHKENQTVLEWYFKCQHADQTIEEFDGLSLISWTDDEQIRFLKEFACKIGI